MLRLFKLLSVLISLLSYDRYVEGGPPPPPNSTAASRTPTGKHN